MSLPPELRTICHLISSTEHSKLPYITPKLLRNVMCCGEVLSAGDENAKRSDASESLVLVHKFKTQLSTLLNGKTPGGRFAAVVLIKAVVELGGWEILRGCESWVKGLLSVLAKPDTAAIKSICVLTLTSIYSLTHQYQSLIREFTTPTLPTFVTSCLNLVPKSTSVPCKNLNGQESLVESVFDAFAALIPRHPGIFRPFKNQIQLAARLYVAPTMSDECFVAPSLQESACRLNVIIHQAAQKNSAGVEWAKAVRLYIDASHVTADLVFRAVVEDWESSSGYVSQQVDMNAMLQGGSNSDEELPEWSGILAGVERLTGFLALLAQYLRSPTSAAVTIPAGKILDLVTRMLSLAKPLGAARGSGSARMNPAIDRDEREGLWDGLPRIHVASMQLLMAMADRLQASFLPLSQVCLDQITWLFPFGQTNEEFRNVSYLAIAKMLRCGGRMLPKDSVSKMSPVISACCNDLLPAHAKHSETQLARKEGVNKGNSNGANSNADTFLQSDGILSEDSNQQSAGLLVAANELLPTFLSHLPQSHLGVSLRSQIERTAIIIHHDDAMIASVLYPFSVNGRTLPSIMPHLSRQYPDVAAVEALLRPRLPPLPELRQNLQALSLEDAELAKDLIIDDMELDRYQNTATTELVPESQKSLQKCTKSTASKRQLSEELSNDAWGMATGTAPIKRGKFDNAGEHQTVREISRSSTEINTTQPILDQNVSGDMEEDSDDESVPPLQMEFDSSSEE